MDGWWVLQQLKEDPELCETPVINGDDCRRQKSRLHAGGSGLHHQAPGSGAKQVAWFSGLL